MFMLLLAVFKVLLARLAGSDDPAQASRFIQGFVTASLVFCIGPMTFLGSLQDGLTGNYRLLAIKSVLDAFAGLAFAASMGRLLQVPVTAYRLPRGQLWRHALATGLLAVRLEPADSAQEQATPATWRLLLEAGWAGKEGLKILCGGEALPADLAQHALEKSGQFVHLVLLCPVHGISR